MALLSIGTYLPPWGTDAARVNGRDEDAVTMAVEAGRAALQDGVDVDSVVLVTRDLPLLDGGNGAALVAGLGLPPATQVVEQIGGAPSVLDALVSVADSTLVIGADIGPTSGAAAAVVGSEGGVALVPRARVQRSLPTIARGGDGVVHDYADPRLTRERGMRTALDEAGIAEKAVAVVGLAPKDASALCEGGAPRVPTVGASAPLFALAALAESRANGLVLAFEQANMTAVDVTTGVDVSVTRVQRSPQPPPKQALTPGPEIKLSLPAYERAFDAKVRLEAGCCPHCGTLALPPRHRCLGCGAEGDSALVALPRDAVVYTTTTIHTPVPGLATPYTIVIVELGDTGVRLLAQVTGAPPGNIGIGDPGTMVLRRVAERSGVPDYGYSFLPAAAPAAAAQAVAS